MPSLTPQSDLQEIARKSALFACGARRLYEDGGPTKGDMWFFELWHHLNDVAALVAESQTICATCGVKLSEGDTIPCDIAECGVR